MLVPIPDPTKSGSSPGLGHAGSHPQDEKSWREESKELWGAVPTRGSEQNPITVPTDALKMNFTAPDTRPLSLFPWLSPGRSPLFSTHPLAPCHPD